MVRTGNDEVKKSNNEATTSRALSTEKKEEKERKELELRQ